MITSAVALLGAAIPMTHASAQQNQDGRRGNPAVHASQPTAGAGINRGVRAGTVRGGIRADRDTRVAAVRGSDYRNVGAGRNLGDSNWNGRHRGINRLVRVDRYTGDQWRSRAGRTSISVGFDGQSSWYGGYGGSSYGYSGYPYGYDTTNAYYPTSVSSYAYAAPPCNCENYGGSYGSYAYVDRPYTGSGNNVFVGNTYVGSDPDPFIRSQLRRDWYLGGRNEW